ncbi:MAG TPA: ribonuclease HII [Amaricoccus sp.]|nr:ribonuclease HII [Amaricoccus sp.]
MAEDGLRAPHYDFEREGPLPVCGIDEVGRGPWAGPVVAAAVILDPRGIPDGLNDSKRLAPERRAELATMLEARATVALGVASVAEIETMNILQASFLAMRRAILGLATRPALALVDGNKAPPGLPCACRPIVGGDGLALSIAAASIVAKVARDRTMVALAQQFPGYGWETNMGYGTRSHQEGLARFGVTPHHRRSFQPIHKILCETIAETS